MTARDCVCERQEKKKQHNHVSVSAYVKLALCLLQSYHMDENVPLSHH